MGDTDPLFELRNLFLIGNYQAAINEGLTLDHLVDAHKVERDVLIYRSYIAKGDYNIVLEEIKDSNPNAGLVAVKALASYLSSERNKDIVLTTVKSWPTDARMVNNEIVQLVSGLIYFYEEDYDEVFRALHQSRTLEGFGSSCILLSFKRIHRLDHPRWSLILFIFAQACFACASLHPDRQARPGTEGTRHNAGHRR
jgi:coatomer protein complex subunit epsilon